MRKNNKFVFYKLEEITRRKNIPWHIFFELTYKCNLRCVHCYIVKEKREELNLEEIKEVLRQLKKAKVLFLTYTGGEIFTKKDIIEILKFSYKLGFAFRIFTNAILINKEIAEILSEIHPWEIGISLYGINEKTHEKITDVSGSFSQTLKAIELLREKKLRIKIKCPVMKQNYSEYQKILKFAKKIGAKYNFDLNLTPKDDGSFEPLKWQLNKEEMFSIYKNPKLFAFKNLKKFKTNKNFCSAGKNVACISPYGDVYPCLLFKMSAGNLKESSFQKIWRDSSALKIIRKAKISDIKKCFNCNLSLYCSYCPGIAYLETKDFLEPSSLLCQKAKIREELCLSV